MVRITYMMFSLLKSSLIGRQELTQIRTATITLIKMRGNQNKKYLKSKKLIKMIK